MSSNPQVPYFGISPDAALEALGPPMTTAGFSQVAAACRKGRDDLVAQGLDDRGRKRLRRFSTWEITKKTILFR